MLEAQQPHALATLPFTIVEMGHLKSLWSAARTGDYAADNAVGAGYADALMAHMTANENPSLLGMVAREIAACGTWSGVEVGFFHRVAETASR